MEIKVEKKIGAATKTCPGCKGNRCDAEYCEGDLCFSREHYHDPDCRCEECCEVFDEMEE